MVHARSLWSKRPLTCCHNSRASPAPAPFTIIDFPDHSEGHCPCSYFVSIQHHNSRPQKCQYGTPQKAQQGLTDTVDMPLQTRVNAIHHVRSERNSTFSQIKWLGSCTECSSENMRHRKLLPAGMPSSVPPTSGPGSPLQNI